MNVNNNADNHVTDMRHNDYVGGDASMGRIPGAETAETGHYYVSVFPKEGEQKRHADRAARPDEHVPPPTGRDIPPKGLNQPALPTEQGPVRIAAARGREPAPGPHFEQNAPQPLPPAPDSRTVIDRDPFATPTTAADTMTGATSKDVHSGIGKPAGGMNSAETHHDGQTHRKKHGQGLDQFGTTGGSRLQNEQDISVPGEPL